MRSTRQSGQRWVYWVVGHDGRGHGGGVQAGQRRQGLPGLPQAAQAHRGPDATHLHRAHRLAHRAEVVRVRHARVRRGVTTTLRHPHGQRDGVRGLREARDGSVRSVYRVRSLQVRHAGRAQRITPAAAGDPQDRPKTGVSAGGDSPLGEPVQPGGRPGRGARVSAARGGAGTQEALRGRQRGGVEWVEGFARGLRGTRGARRSEGANRRRRGVHELRHAERARRARVRAQGG